MSYHEANELPMYPITPNLILASFPDRRVMVLETYFHKYIPVETNASVAVRVPAIIPV